MDRIEFTRIVDQYYDDVKRIAFAGCKNTYDAEDVAQTVFMKLSQYQGNFKSDEHIKKWLIKVAVNEYRPLHEPCELNAAQESYGPFAHRYSKGRISKEVPGCARNGRDSAQRRYTPSVTHSSRHGRER